MTAQCKESSHKEIRKHLQLGWMQLCPANYNRYKQSHCAEPEWRRARQFVATRRRERTLVAPRSSRATPTRYVRTCNIRGQT